MDCSTPGRQSSTISLNLLKLKSIESVMPSNHLILCTPLLLLPLIFSSIRVFSNESALSIRWPKYWSFNFSPSNKYLISFRMQFDLLALLRVFSSTTIWKHQFLGALTLKKLPVMQGGHDPLKKDMATLSSILAWRIPWTEEPGGLQSTGTQRVGHD